MPSHPSTVRRQGETQGSAVHAREPWSAPEIELVVETRDIDAAEVAEALGRTLYAVQGARYALDHGQPLGGGYVPSEAPSSRSQGWTFVGDDVPPGWRD